MKERLENIKQEILEKLSQAGSEDQLKELEVFYFGRKGEFTQILRNLSSLGEEEKKSLGQAANNIKKELETAVSRARAVILEKAENIFIDPTLPGEKLPAGSLNPITLVQNELEDLFISMGFIVLDGPELESDYYCFEALNIPKDHPARDMQDTFYLNKTNDKGERDLVMRTHTSSVQVRAMRKYGAPLRCVVPGRVFRSEATDATHEHTFYQLEGLMIDRDISLANLIAVLKEMLSGIFKREVKIRVRPSYFPFVEPGLEIDINCTICGGSGCPACKHEGWLETVGAGLVHPKVIAAGGLDPEKYSGFAFGMGLNRLVMMKYGISDIRLFQSGDLRFLKQF